jgi:hypothetical protein
MPTLPRPLPAAALVLFFTLGCTSEQAEGKARELGDKAEQAGKELADDAKHKGHELTDELADDAKHKSRELADGLAEKAGDQAKSWWEREVPSTGELSEKGKQLLASGAEQAPGSIEQLLTRGEQLAPTALEIGKTLRDAIESDTIVEPIIQKVDDPAAQTELDKKISDMPRVETIEGVSVGFKDMTVYDSGGRSTESAYLVLWRHDTHLLGFIYRSKKRINVDTLVRETPRLAKLVQGAL